MQKWAHVGPPVHRDDTARVPRRRRHTVHPQRMVLVVVVLVHHGGTGLRARAIALAVASERVVPPEQVEEDEGWVWRGCSCR